MYKTSVVTPFYVFRFLLPIMFANQQEFNENPTVRNTKFLSVNVAKIDILV